MIKILQLTKMPVSRPMLSSEAPALKWRTKYTCRKKEGKALSVKTQTE